MTGSGRRDDAPKRGPATPGRSLAAMALVVAITLAVFLPVAGHDFVDFDDGPYVAGNAAVQRGLTAAGVSWAWSTTWTGNWHPLTWLSLMTDVTLLGSHAGRIKLVNLAYHLAASLLLFAAIAAATGSRWRATLVSLLFAVHPLHVESVAWVSERKDVLSALFWMAGLAAYVRYLRRPSAARYLTLLLCAALGLLAKAMGVTFPVVLLLLDWWPLGRFRAGAGRARLLAEKTPLLALSLAAGMMAMRTQRQWGAIGDPETLSLAVRAATAASSSVVYLWKALWPSALAVFYPHPGVVDGVAAALSASALLILTGAAIRLRRRHPAMLAGWLWYLVTLLPVSGLLQVGAQARADRYTYLPLVGIFLAVATLLDGTPRAGARRKVQVAGCLAFVVVMAILARRQVGFWRDSPTLFGHALAVTSGNWLVEQNLAGYLARRGEVARAEELYRSALRHRPGLAEASADLGLIVYHRGDLEEAERLYREALRRKPSLAETHANLGALLADRGRVVEAMGEYRESIRLKPGYAPGWHNLGVALESLGRLDEAAEAYRGAIGAQPEFEPSWSALVTLVSSRAGIAAAATELQRLLALHPRSAAGRAAWLRLSGKEG
jgi:tetratricopeptide (TPR) repeat protein